MKFASWQTAPNGRIQPGRRLLCGAWSLRRTAIAIVAALLFGAAARATGHPPALPGEFEETVEVVMEDIFFTSDVDNADANIAVEGFALLAAENAVAIDVDLAVDVGFEIADIEIADAVPAQQPDDEWDDEEVDPAVVPPQPRFVVNDETFDQWVFNQVGNWLKATERFHTSLSVQIDAIAAACELAPEQRQKLLLAGRGDIQRFFDKVEVCRKKFDVVKTDQNRINEIFLDIQPLQLAATSGLFDEKSLFRKVIHRTLNEEQCAKVDQIEKERRQYQFKAKVNLIVASLDDTLAMRADQRKELTALLLATPPPKRYGPYDAYLLLYKVSRLPEDKMKKLFDPVQLRALDKQLDRARNLQAFLRQQGLLSEDEIEP